MYCGDKVLFEKIKNAQEIDGYVTIVKRRENFLVRPNISNIDLCLLILSFKNPQLSHYFIAKALLFLNKGNINYKLVFTKKDLLDAKHRKQILNIYRLEGISVDSISYGNYKNLNFKKHQNICLIGKSGVGKTTLINNLTKKSFLTQNVSKKSNKGKHTTTNLSGKIVGNSIIFDSPGFEKISIQEFIQKDISKYFFSKAILNSFKCDFNTCNHLDKNHCEFINLVNKKKISKIRYEIYKKFFYEAKKTYW